MKIKYSLILLLGIYFSLISATSIPVAETKVTEDTTAKVSTSLKLPAEVKTKKMGFFQRLAFKIAMRKLKKHHYKMYDDATKADNMANTSLWLGSLALLFALIPWYTLLLAIPLGVLAIIFAGNAKRSGTKKISNANIGKGLGIAALVVFATWIIAGLIVWAAFLSAW